MKRALAVVASKRASVVLPVPGAPQRISEGRVPALSIKRRKIRPEPTRWLWPTNSSRVRGRIRSASGAAESTAALSPAELGASPKRLLLVGLIRNFAPSDLLPSAIHQSTELLFGFT